jgi:O-antigen/teichoic acid export membrane protein
MNRTHRASWGFLTGLALAGVTVTISLVTTPLFLRWLGEEKFGAFRTVIDWTGHLGVLELGLSGALIPLLVQALSRGPDAVRAVLGVGIRVYLKLLPLMLAAGAAMTWLIPNLVPLGAAATQDLKGGCWFALLTFLAVPMSPFRALAEAGQRSYLINGLLILQALVATGLGLLLAWMGWGITGQCLALSLGSVVFLTFLARDGLGRYPSNQNAQGDPTQLRTLTPIAGAAPEQPGSTAQEIRRQVRKLNGPSLLQYLCGRIGLYTDNTLIAFFWGPAQVVPFFLTQRMAFLAQTQLQGIGNSSWAGLVELAMKGPPGVFQRRLIELSSLVMILGTAVMTSLAAFNRPFVSLWVGPQGYGGDGVAILAAANGILLALFSLWGLVLCGAGHVSRVVPGVVAATSVNITASVIGTIAVGLPGPLLGTFLSFLLVNTWFYPMLLRQHFQVELPKLLRAVVSPVLVGLPYTFLIWWIARIHPPQNWMTLAFEAGCSALMYLVLAWVTILKSEERAEWIGRLRLTRRLWPAG